MRKKAQLGIPTGIGVAVTLAGMAFSAWAATVEESDTPPADYYVAYPNKIPVISAGARVTGWTKTQVSGHAAGVAEAPAWSFRQLWVNGQRRHRPRLPKQGFYRVTSALPSEDYSRGQQEFIAAPSETAHGVI